MVALMKGIKPLLNKWWFILTMYFGVLTVSSLGYSFFEGKPLVDSIWWSIVTGMTVGYGDMFPVTAGGRIIATFLMHAVPFFIAPLIIAKIITTVLENRDAFTHEEQEKLKADLALTREVVEKNNFTTEEQAEVIGLLRESVPLLRLIQSQTDEIEDVLGVGDEDVLEAVTA